MRTFQDIHNFVLSLTVDLGGETDCVTEHSFVTYPFVIAPTW